LRVALDTNVLVYAEGINGNNVKNKAVALLSALPVSAVAVPTQVLAELYNILVRRGKQSRTAAEDSVIEWRNQYSCIDTSAPVLDVSLELATNHQFTIWDGIVLAAAAEGGCRLLLSEDLHDGFSWRGVTVANPFSDSRHPLLPNF
jgi:predicted nucleic acid-binding protein